MKKIVLSQLFLLLFFASLFILNDVYTRFGIGIYVNVVTFILIVIVVLSITLIPPIRTLNLYYLILISTILYIITRVIPHLSPNIKPYIEFAFEYVILMFSIFLAIQNNHAMDEIKIKLDIFNIPKTKHQILDLLETSDSIELEFNRARRYNYPISIIVIKLRSQIQDSGKRLEDPQKTYNRKLAYKQLVYQLIKSLDDFVREFDQIIKIDDQKQVLVLCPETDEEHAKKLVDRLYEKVFTSMDLNPEIEVALFPKDGPTFHSILSIIDSKKVD